MLFSSSHSRPRYSQLAGSSDALALAQYAAKHSPLAVIAANALEAQRLVEEIPFFAPELRVHLLPDWETLPYDHFSPHQDLISERLATLHHIRSGSCDVIVVPVTTALYPLPPVEYLAAFTFFLKRGEKLDLNKLREQMTFAGYNHDALAIASELATARIEAVKRHRPYSTVVATFDGTSETSANPSMSSYPGYTRTTSAVRTGPSSTADYVTVTVTVVHAATSTTVRKTLVLAAF